MWFSPVAPAALSVRRQRLWSGCAEEIGTLTARKTTLRRDRGGKAAEQPLFRYVPAWREGPLASRSLQPPTWNSPWWPHGIEWRGGLFPPYRPLLTTPPTAPCRLQSAFVCHTRSATQIERGARRVAATGRWPAEQHQHTSSPQLFPPPALPFSGRHPEPRTQSRKTAVASPPARGPPGEGLALNDSLRRPRSAGDGRLPTVYARRGDQAPASHGQAVGGRLRRTACPRERGLALLSLRD